MTAVIMLWINVMIIMTRAGGTRVCCRHCTSRWWKWTFDVLQRRFLLGNWNFEWTIDGSWIFNRCRLAGRRVMLAILINQILKLYPNICTWKAQCAAINVKFCEWMKVYEKFDSTYELGSRVGSLLLRMNWSSMKTPFLLAHTKLKSCPS